MAAGHRPECGIRVRVTRATGTIIRWITVVGCLIVKRQPGDARAFVRLMPGAVSGFHFALKPEGRLDAGCGEAVEDCLGLVLIGACRLVAVLEHEPQPG